MGETWDMVPPGAKFLSICGPVKPENKLCPSKIQWWVRHEMDIPSPKGERGREKGAHGSQASLKPSAQV